MTQQQPDATRPGGLHRAARVTAEAVGWVLLVVVGWLAWPATLGGLTSYVLVSGESMLPTYDPKDMVIARDVEPQVGDVIVYAPASLEGAQIGHRIIGGDAESGWVLQGDNNDFIDPFEPTGDEVKGVVQLHLPLVGHLAVWVLNPLTWVFLLIIGGAILLWPARDEDEFDDDESDDESDADTGGDPDIAATAAPASAVRASRRAPMAFAALLCAAALTVAAGVSPASAAQLHVTAPFQPTVSVLQKCSAAVTSGGAAVLKATTASASATSLSLSEIPAACQGLAVSVYVHGASGQTLATGTASAASGQSTRTVTTSSFTRASVAFVVVKVNGWVFPVTWTVPVTDPTPPVGPVVCYQLDSSGAPVLDAAGMGVRCPTTPTVSPGKPWLDGGTVPTMLAEYALSTVQVRSLLVFNFADPAFAAYQGAPATSSYRLSPYNGGGAIAAGYTCSQRPVVKLVVTHPNVAWGAQTLSGGIRVTTVAQTGQFCGP
ncbi:MAG: S24/S26 family peptidase [Demequina sp.]|uniref:S24/S26 family peptidase n=1 Tax=Demequina sp. TaxID=2050685 RepID=UPI003A8B7A21